MSDFADILATVATDIPVVISPEKRNLVSISVEDQLNLSVQGQKRLPARPGKMSVELPTPAILTDRQGNRSGFSTKAAELAAQSGNVAWETVTKIKTDLPDIRPDKKRVAELLKAGVLQEDKRD